MARRYRGGWTNAELALMHERYAELGAKGMAPLLPNRTRKAIGLKAHELFLTNPMKARNTAQENVPLAPLPTMTDDEREACRFFRTWRYPAEPAQLRWAA